MKHILIQPIWNHKKHILSMLRKNLCCAITNSCCAKYNKILFTCKQAPSNLHSNVNKRYKFTYSTQNSWNLEVHKDELTSLRSMGGYTEYVWLRKSSLSIYMPSGRGTELHDHKEPGKRWKTFISEGRSTMRFVISAWHWIITIFLPRISRSLLNT